MVAALVRSSTRASRPPVPAASTNPVCHRSQASTRRFLCGSRAQIGLPRRVSSIPSTATGCSGAAVGGPDVGRERGVHDGPVHAVVGSGFRDNPALFGDRVPELGPWPRRQPRAARTAGSDSLNECRGKAVPCSAIAAYVRSTATLLFRKGYHAAAYRPDP